jgi:RimJ/RimL family protein N-acetyltransferase
MITLRRTTEDDLELVMAWRSNPIVFDGFYSQTKPLEWGEHVHWFRSRNQDWRNFIIEYNGRDVGILTIGQLDHWSPEIGYAIGEVSLWGHGVGKDAVKLALDYIRDHGRDYCHTTVLKRNQRSISLLKSLGFVESGDAREGEIWLRKKLS